jgi:putative acyl-CoA dehydrogenase
MPHFRPRSALATHDVTNQPPPFEDINLYANDAALMGAVEAGGG